MHHKCAGISNQKSQWDNIRCIALKVPNSQDGFCGFGVLVMSGCACACDEWWVVIVDDVGCSLVHVLVSAAKVCVWESCCQCVHTKPSSKLGSSSRSKASKHLWLNIPAPVRSPHTWWIMFGGGKRVGWKMIKWNRVQVKKKKNSTCCRKIVLVHSLLLFPTCRKM